MSKVIRSDVYEYQGKLWKVNPAKSGLRTDILRVLLAQFNSLLIQHRKIFVYRFDLSVHDHTENNEQIGILVRRLSRRVERYYKDKLTYCWVREHEKSKQQHYHFCLMLNGSKVNNPHTLQTWLTLIWEQYQYGRCSWAGYHNIERDDWLVIQDTTFHISYLAKPRGKGYRAIQTKDYGHSRI